MPLFTTNSNNIFGAGVAEAGAYNVKIVNAPTSKSKNGNEYMSLDYQVLDGKYKGGEIRYQNVTWSADDVDMSAKRFNTIAAAVGVPDGTPIESVAQFAKALIGKTLSITVDWGEPNNKGKIYLGVTGYGAVDPDGSKPNGQKRPNSGSGNSSKSKGNGDPFKTAPGQPIDISDDDLPF